MKRQREYLGGKLRWKGEGHQPWKRVICWVIGHDWGMYWIGAGTGTKDVCARCGKEERHE